MITDVTGVLLAGGQSRRMGEDKRFLHVGGRTLIERSLGVLRLLFQDVCIVIGQNTPALQAAVPVLRDIVANSGSLGGIYTGLKLAEMEFVFVVACDMPFLNPTAIRHLVELKDEADLIIVRSENGLQPTHAVYSRRCLPVIEQMVQARHLRIQELIDHPSLRVRCVSMEELRRIVPEARAFFNVNTPEDLEAAKKLWADGNDCRATI